MASIESTTLNTIDQSFFFNDQYDDQIVYQEMLSNRRKNYFNCIKEERRINDYHVYSLKLSQFVINEELNIKYGLSEGSLSYYVDYSDGKSNSAYDINVVDVFNDTVITYQENFSIFPYYNKKRFLDKFGRDRIITLDDIYANHDIFRYSIFCQINSIYFFGLEFIEDTNGCYLVIELDKNRGIGSLESLYKKFDLINTEEYLDYFGKDATIRIFYQNHNEIFHTYRAKHLLFESTDKYYAYLDLTIFKEISKYDKPNISHRWILYISFIIDEKNLAVAIPAESVTINSKDKIRIPLQTAQMIQNSVANCNCYLVNQYNQFEYSKVDITSDVIPGAGGHSNYQKYISFITKYLTEETEETWVVIGIQIVGEKVPIQKMRLFTYYPDTGIIGDLVTDTINQSKYIYEDSILDEIDHGKFRSFLNDAGFEASGSIILIKNPEVYSTKQFYLELYESDTNICEYDYPNREIIDCYGQSYLKEFLDDSDINPRFLHYYISPLSEYSNVKNQDLRLTRYQLLNEVLHESIDRCRTLTAKLYQKNKSSIRKIYRQEDYPNIFSRSVYDNHQVIHDINELITFSEEMMYITVNLAKYIKPSAIIFINGIRINTDLIYVDRKTAYIFFKKKYLKKENNVIDVEVFLYDTTPNHKIDDVISFFSTGISTTIPNNEKYDRMSIKNLMLYDKRTNQYLNSSDISFRYKLGVVELNQPDNENYYEFLFDPDDIDYYMTHHNEFFIDDNSIFLMVRKESVLYDCPVTYKKLNIENVYIKLLSSHRINHELGITNTNNYRKLFVEDGLKSATITMKNFKEVSDKNRFRVYYGGKLMGDTEYTIALPKKYDEDVSISINNISTLDNNREIILEYLPIEEFLYCDGIPNSEEWVSSGYDNLITVDQKDSLVHLNDKYIVNTDMLKVYIDGYRIPNDNIVQLPGGNYFIIKDLIPGKRLTVYIDAHDESLYQSETSINPTGFTLCHDTKFRNYMLRKYNK